MSLTTFARFKVSYYSTKPERVEFVRETAHYLIQANGVRQAKKSSYYTFHTTEQEALHAIELRNRREAERIAKRRIEAHGAELLEALQRLSQAAFRRDITTGDPCTLIEVKEELRAASKHANEVIAKAKGEQSA